MNFLAHLFLSCDDEDLMIGNFIADFIKNKEVRNYAPQIQKGIFLHRQIDTFTDAHPMVKQGTHRLQYAHHKYSPVIVDVFYDYLLAKNWERYSGETLDEFCETVYDILEKRINELPPKLQKRLPNMIHHQWLQAYGTEEGIRYTFKRLTERISKPEYMHQVVDNLLEYENDFNEEFNSFFPEVMEFVREQCLCG